MSSGFTETNIYQMVLDRLVEQSILSTTDDNAAARWLSRNYPLQRDVLLQKSPWNFGMKRAQLAADVAAPAFEWKYQYTLPSDCLHLEPVTCDGKKDSPVIPYVVENGRVLTNQAAPLNVRYRSRQTDVGQFSPLFINLLVQALAAAYAYTVTGKASFMKGLTDALPGMQADAQLINALESQPAQPDDSDIIMVR